MHPQKRQLTTFLTQRKLDIDNIIYTLQSNGECEGMSVTAIKNKVLAVLFPQNDKPVSTFSERFYAFAMSKTNRRTRDIYLLTYHRMQKFAKRDFKLLTMESITKDWLTAFDNFMCENGLMKNTRNICFRNIRAVFNDAIDNEVTTNYPFRKFKIKPEATRKRSFSVEVLRKILTADLPEWQCKYRDMFALTFYLIGINIGDLCNLSDMEGGRVSYNRAKTHKPYSVKVEPEAEAIINKYRGEKQLLYILDRYKTYRIYYNQLYQGLRSVLTSLNNINDGITIQELSTYWARHSWATIAASLDIPKETIAAALGHDMGNSTTAIYIDFDRSKVDEANRRVIDWVLYGKR